MSSTDHHENLTLAELEHLQRLESIVQEGLGTYADVDDALARIHEERLYRDTHDSFDAYARERWGIRGPDGPDATLGTVWEQALGAIAGDDVAAADIRITIRKQNTAPGTPSDPAPPAPIAKLVGDEGLPRLRWLLAQANGLIAGVTHRLEAHSDLLGDAARAHLGDDILALEDELVRLQAILAGPPDWDAEYGRLVRGEIPPFDDVERESGD